MSAGYLIYTPNYGGSTTNTAGIPRPAALRSGMAPTWPEGRMVSTPPPKPPPPVLSLAYPLIPRRTGPASLA